jgi:hypothetical protein
VDCGVQSEGVVVRSLRRRVEGLGLGVWGVGFGVQGSGFRV